MQTWQILTFLAVIFWGTAQVFVKKGMARLAPPDAYFVGGVCGLPILISYALFRGIHLTRDPLIFLACLYIVISYLIYYSGIYRGKLSISATIISTYPMVTVILAFLFLSERIRPHQIIAIIAIVGGTAFLARSVDEDKTGTSLRPGTWIIMLPLAAALAIGTGDILTKLVITHHGIDDLLVYTSVFQLLLATGIKIGKEGRNFSLGVFRVRPAVAGSVLLTCGSLFFYEALNSGEVSLVIPLSSAYAPLTVLLSVFLLHEKFQRKTWGAICIILAGVLLINI